MSNREIPINYIDGEWCFQNAPSTSSRGRKNEERGTDGRFGSTHGYSNSNLKDVRSIWFQIISRCTNPKDKAWHNYGERGICISETWEFNFEQFVLDIGPRPSLQHTVERKDNNGDYCKENCIWLLRRNQNRNKRTNHQITAFGKTQSITHWCEELYLPYSTVAMRLLRGDSPEDALRSNGK